MHVKITPRRVKSADQQVRLHYGPAHHLSRLYYCRLLFFRFFFYLLFETFTLRRDGRRVIIIHKHAGWTVYYCLLHKYVFAYIWRANNSESKYNNMWRRSEWIKKRRRDSDYIDRKSSIHLNRNIDRNGWSRRPFYIITQCAWIRHDFSGQLSCGSHPQSGGDFYTNQCVKLVVKNCSDAIDDFPAHYNLSRDHARRILQFQHRFATFSQRVTIYNVYAPFAETISPLYTFMERSHVF